jgi:RHS repeat-associated protein
MEHNDADQLTKITQRDSWLGGELNQWYKREYGHDDNGCLTQEYVSRELWNTNATIDEYRNEYSWDYDNRLTGSEKTVLIPHDEIDGMTGAVMERTYTDGPSISTEYIYDASGVRIGRVHNSVTNYFVIDYNAPLKMPLAETAADGNITRYYIWSSHGLLAHLDVNPSTGAITATRYYHSDEQGSTLALTDESGNVTDEFAYTPYGGVNHIGTTDTPFQWLGGIAVQNEGDGLYFMLNRTYSADMRRFISADPSGIDGGVNLYAYGALNPLAYSDPFGLEAQSFSSRLSGVAKGVGMMAAGFVPYLGDAMDMYDVASPNSSALTRSLSGASLAVNVWTAGLAPNLGPIRRGAGMVADAFSSGAKNPGVKYIGKMDDLRGIPRSQTLLDDLPDLGSAKANYYQNSSVLRGVVRDGYEIRDASFYRPNSSPDSTLLRPDRTVGQSFLGAERLIMDNKGLVPNSGGTYIPR